MVENFITDEFKDTVRTVLNAAFEGKETANFEFPFFSKAQTIVLNATTLRGPDGEVIGYGAVEVQRIKPCGRQVVGCGTVEVG